MSFSQALSGLRAQAENIKVISNNIANSQTVGFKAGNVMFADVFAGASQVGLGVNVSGVMQDFRSGDLENTGRNLDLAIAGQGFYRLEKVNGELVYSRNGEFNQDRNGFLVNGTGDYLTGYVMDENNEAFPFSPVIDGAAPQRLQIPQDDMPPNATTEARAVYNLDASIDHTDPALLNTTRLEAVDGDGDLITVDANGAYDAAGDNAEIELSYHFSSSYTAFDSLGNARTVTTYYQKQDDNVWTSYQAVDGRLAFDGVAGGASALKNAFWMQFNQDGQLITFNEVGTGTAGARDTDDVVGVVSAGFDLTFGTPNVLDLSLPLTNAEGFSLADAYATAQVDNNAETSDRTSLDYPVDGGAFPLGAAPLGYEFILAGTSQFSNNSVLNTLEQNGYTSGTLIGIEVDKDGTVIRTFTNGERADAGQIVLTNFLNPEGLQPDGNNAWRATNASGDPILGVGGTGIFGTIEGGVLENSNVDLAQQLVDMIVSQRAYQANSSSIGTQDEMLQTVINL